MLHNSSAALRVALGAPATLRAYSIRLYRLYGWLLAPWPDRELERHAVHCQTCGCLCGSLWTAFHETWRRHLIVSSFFSLYPICNCENDTLPGI